MTLVEAAAALGVQPATLRQQIAAGRLRAKKVGRDWQVTTREVQRYEAEVRGRPGRRPK
jgi:excisionase family DNA binding protein